MKQTISFLTALLLLATVSACSSSQPKKAESINTASSKSEINKAESNKTIKEIYEVHHDGRIHVFYDRKLYKEFLSLGETPFRLTRIGAGPNGETLVFGLTRKDKKMKSPVPAIELYEGKTKPDSEFYAEMVKHNRIYVFSDFEDMKPVRQFGHPNFFYTQIGSGPNGETVVYVLNKSNKKHRPDPLINKFKNINS